MTDRVPPRLFILLASHAPVGIVVRRGPTKWSHLTKWNTQTDKFERGQWLSARVYERRCDVSPDGSKLLYFAVDNRYHSQTKGAFSAVSKPPYWAALALWPKGNTEGGGGVFIDGLTIFLNQANTPLPSRPPKGIKIAPSHPEGPFVHPDLSIYYARLRRDGWTPVSKGAETDEPRIDVWRREFEGAPFSLLKDATTSANPPYGFGRHYDRHALEFQGQRIELPDAEWADFDQAGRLVFTRSGALYAAAIANGQLTETLLCDFNADVPAPVKAPRWAESW